MQTRAAIPLTKGEPEESYFGLSSLSLCVGFLQFSLLLLHRCRGVFSAISF